MICDVCGSTHDVSAHSDDWTTELSIYYLCAVCLRQEYEDE